MTNIELMEKALPTAPLKIAALESCKNLAEKVDQYIVSFRKNSLHDFLDPAIYSSYEADSYLAKNSCPRFGSGEAKGMFGESIRGRVSKRSVWNPGTEIPIISVVFLKNGQV